MTLPSRRNDAQPVLWVVGLLVLVLLALVGSWQCRALAQRAGPAAALGALAVQAAPSALAAAPSPTHDGAAIETPLLLAAMPPRIVEEENAVVFYFADDQAQLPPDAAKALGSIVRGVAAGQIAVIHSYERDDASHQQTARRVLSVHNLLVSLGIGEDKIRRAEPEVVPAWAQASEAGRVEVVLDAG